MVSGGVRGARLRTGDGKVAVAVRARYIHPMNKRLDDAVAAARKTLDDDLQDDLAALVEAFVSGCASDGPAALTPEEDAALERHLDTTHPIAEAGDHDRWLRAKIERAVEQADSVPGQGASLAEMQKRFGLEP